MHRKIFNQREKLQADVVLQQTHNCAGSTERTQTQTHALKHELKIQLYCSEWKREYKTILGTLGNAHNHEGDADMRDG